MERLEHLRGYMMLPYLIATKFISLTLIAIFAGIIIYIIKWVYPITQRKLSSINDLKNKRSAARIHHHESVLLADNEDFVSAETTFTLNISNKGCLVLTSKPRSKGDIVWIDFNDTYSVKTGIVRRLLQSDTNKTIGVGIEYL